ncbi:MAG TPA: aquaporin [Opitutaceae bacterium]|jgi:aquaporin Z|nr:aquaporin [Opitutaceae bacterium]HRE04111.1 aquaporin [Opitutaceae bacterium]
MKKYLVEFIGTFFLVATVGFSVRSGSNLAPIAIGGVLMVMIFAGGHVSGGHYNPAVSLAAFIRGKLSGGDLLPYWVAQVAAGAVAALVVNAVVGRPTAAPGTFLLVPSIIVEALFTFALAWTVLNTATAKGTQGNSFYGLAIGFTVVAGAISVGGISGGAFNPAVGVGVTMMSLVPTSQLPVYVGADLAGGALAALAYLFVNGRE